MVQSILLWAVGVAFLGMAPFVTNTNSQKRPTGTMLGLILIGALCVRFA